MTMGDWQGVARSVLRVFKHIFSASLTLAALAFVCYGNIIGKAALKDTHWIVNFMIFIFALVLLAYLEGLQVAILALESSNREDWEETHPRAFRLHEIATRGKNVQRFLVGRQFFVIFVVMMSSQVTTFPELERPDEFPAFLWFALVETALPGALIVLAFGQLMPQLIASRHSVLFCNLPGAICVLYLTLILEATGLTHFSWLLTATVARLFGIHSLSDDAEASEEIRDPETGHEVAELPKPDAFVKIAKRWKDVALSEDVFHLTSSEQKDVDIAPLEASMVVLEPAMVGAGLQPSGTIDRMTKLPRAKVYPTPERIAQLLTESGQSVPCFLLPTSHPDHVPPHVVAFGLMSGMVQQRQQHIARISEDCQKREA
jgi:hypothetical protein